MTEQTYDKQSFAKWILSFGQQILYPFDIIYDMGCIMSMQDEMTEEYRDPYSIPPNVYRSFFFSVSEYGTHLFGSDQMDIVRSLVEHNSHAGQRYFFINLYFFCNYYPTTEFAIVREYSREELKTMH